MTGSEPPGDSPAHGPPGPPPRRASRRGGRSARGGRASRASRPASRAVARSRARRRRQGLFSSWVRPALLTACGRLDSQRSTRLAGGAAALDRELSRACDRCPLASRSRRGDAAREITGPRSVHGGVVDHCHCIAGVAVVESDRADAGVRLERGVVTGSACASTSRSLSPSSASQPFAPQAVRARAKSVDTPFDAWNV